MRNKSILEQVLEVVSDYEINGEFETKMKTKLSDIFPNHTIPKDLRNNGVYIFTLNNEIVYIGKNGTMKSKGNFGNHTLNKRILQGKLKTKWIGSDNYKVYWFVTNFKGEKVNADNIPSVVECSLLKKYYEITGSLPIHNNSF